ncbi:TIM barrel protein [Sphingobium sp.]|uniref:TIM barrel protein n=1 Tax=Sphingobium sp. TaxID=1912891 RepID=UPI0028BE8949|nr:TIM barrel protein [Sphingobium sp.]
MGAVKGFRLDFAPHLGFPTPETPLFGALAGNDTPAAQIAFASARGFRRVQDPFTARRDEDEQARIGALAKAAGLAMGCFVYAPMERAAQPAWSATDGVSRAALDADVDAAIAIGRRIGSRHIAVLTGTDPARTRAEQRHAMTANLARLADRVAQAGMMLCIEAVNAQRLPHMLLHHLGDAADIVRGVGHPAVRLIFDTAHVQAMDGDILGNLDRTWDLIEIVQLADHPGRMEPGAGELNFERIIDEIERRGFAGPVELEHGWASACPENQEKYLQWLMRWALGDERKTDGDAAA